MTQVCWSCKKPLDSPLDGANLCHECGSHWTEEREAEYQRIRAKREKANARRRARNQALRDLGLVRVRGALGGVYWE